MTTVRKYYKYTTTPNCKYIGSITNTNGVISGFGTANYARLPFLFNPLNKTWELQTKFKLTDLNSSSWHSLFGSATADYSAGMNLHVSSGKIKNEFTANNSGWGIGNIIGQTLEINKDYWVKTGWNGSIYYLDLSTDGNTYTRQGSISSTAVMKANTIQTIGISSYNTGTYLRGSIDLTQTKIICNGVEIWHGTTSTTGTSSSYDYYVDEDVKKCVKQTIRKYYKYKTTASGYKELDYIYAPSGTLIDTNFIPNSNTKIDCMMRWTKIDTNNFAFGAGVGYQDRNIELYSSGASFEIHYSAYTTIGSYTYGKYFRFVQDKGLVTVYNENGSQNSTYNFGTKTFDCVYKMHIFGLNRGSNNPSPYPNYLRYFKIWDNGTLVRDYVPVERVSDSVVGLYDKQNNVFYTNIGSGSFTKGNYVIIDGTSSSYDFYKDEEIYKVNKTNDVYSVMNL